MKNLLLRSTACLSVLLFFITCKDETSKELGSKQKVVDTILVENSFDSDAYHFIIPSPLALYNSFNSIAASGNLQLLNHTDSLDKYTNKSIQLLNFGIYSTDLAHCVINRQQQEVADYLLAIEELADRIGIGSSFDNSEIREKLDTNLGDKEKLEDLLFEIHDKSQEYLEDNELRFMASVQFCGAWIEGVYLGLTFNDSSTNIEWLSEVLNSQMTLLDNCMLVLADYPNDDEHITRLNIELLELQKLHAQFTTIDSETLTTTQVNQIKKKISAIRNSII